MSPRVRRALAYAGACLVSTLCVAGASRQSSPEPVSYHSPTALAADAAGGFIYVADETAAAVIRVDLRDNSTRTISLPGRPTGIALGKTSERLYVTGDAPAGVVWAVNLTTGTIDFTIAAGTGARSPVLNVDESVLYVSNRFDNDISVIDLKQHRELARVPAVREPIAAALSPDGKLLVVGNEKPAMPATGSQVSSAVTFIDTASNKAISHVELPDGGVSIRGVATSPDGQHAFVTHILGRHHQPATQLDDGWLTTNAVSIIDMGQRSRLATVLLDQPRRGAANPWGVAVTEDGGKLLVSLAGVHELAVIALPELLQQLKTMATAAPVAEPPVYGAVGRPDTDLSFMRKYLVRKQLSGRGPRPLIVSRGRVYLGMYFSGSVESVGLDEPPAASKLIPVGSQPVESEIRRGERLFNDGSIAFQGWLSCSTCHPDGRSDGLNWDLSNDGIGNPRNAKSLVLSHKTPPVMWTGLFPTLGDCVPFEVRTVLFSGRPPQDSAAIVAYLSSLTPAPSPFLQKGELSESAKRGEAAVQKAGCSECHKGEFLTNMEKRSVGVYSDRDPREFDVPTWREVWRTAPYLHDGRAASVKDIFTSFDPENRHGRHQTLSPQELDDLVQFVLSQ